MGAFDLGSIFDTAKAVQGIFGGSQQPQQAQTPHTSSTIDQILAGLQKGPTTGEKVADVGSILGAFSQGEKANRLSGAGLQQDYDRMMLGDQIARNNYGLEAAQQRNANETDALRKLQQGSYLAGGGANYAPPTFNLGGQSRTAPSFSFAPQAATAPEQQAGAQLQQSMMGRLANPEVASDWSFHAKPVDEYNHPGVMENIGSYGALAGGALGGLMDIFGDKAVGNGITGAGKAVGSGIVNAGKGIAGLFTGGGSGVNAAFDAAPSISSAAGAANAASIGGVGGSALGGASGLMSNLGSKVVPGLGAATGIMGLMHDKGAPSNIMNGTTAGASIGSMIMPGLGTGIGAGVGALAGALRGVGGPSQEELAGRETAGQARQLMASGATPAQMQEAKSAGWDKPQDALALIVMRDKLNAAGAPPDQANKLMDQLFAAEKHGPQAVQQVMTSISQMLGHA